MYIKIGPVEIDIPIEAMVLLLPAIIAIVLILSEIKCVLIS